MRWVVALLLFAPRILSAATAAEMARAVRESTFDRDECYRIRDLTITRDDVRLYLTDGHLIFSKPVAGRRIAAVFEADVEGGDAEVILMPPDRAERRSLAAYTDTPNLDEHFRSALFLFTGDDYDVLKSQLPNNPANKRTPEVGALLESTWSPVLHNLAASYQTRLTLDLLNPPRHSGLFAGLLTGVKLGSFDVIYDPDTLEQILVGQVAARDERLYFDTWTSFVPRSRRNNPAPKPRIALRGYRIEAAINPDLGLSAVTRVKVTPQLDGMAAVPFDIAPAMEVTAVSVNGRAAEVFQRESLRANLTRGGNEMFLVRPAEPLRAGREYEFEFHHSGRVIHNAGDHVLYVSARGNWYPIHAFQFTDFDLVFQYPQDLDLVAPGEPVEDRTEGETRVTHYRAASPIRVAGFNLGNYAHARVERGGYTVDVCANRTLERALQPPVLEAPPLPPVPPGMRGRRPPSGLAEIPVPPPPDPLAKLKILASDVASALEFMASRFGSPALPRLTVSPIPGTFGQGFPGLIYLSTLAYLKTPVERSQSQEIFYEDMLDAHETAHQWWGNRIVAATYRDAWLMEALANYSAMLYVEKRKGVRSVELMLDSYRTSLLAKSENGQNVDAAGPIVLGTRLGSSQEPRGWRAITYGKGSWIMQMLRRRMGDEPFVAMLREVLKRYDRQEITTEQFRRTAAEFMPPKSDDATLESFFEQWIYGTGIPSLKLTYSLKGNAPQLRVVGTVMQTEVDENFTVLVPVEIQLARGRTITHWVRSAQEPVMFSVAVSQAPLKVSLDPHYAVLRR